MGCSSALERLGVATPGELAGVLGRNSIANAAHGVVGMRFRPDSRGPRLKQAPAASRAPRSHLPLASGACVRRTTRRIVFESGASIHQSRSQRAQRLFDFDYRFEAFVREERKYGYYVLPLLERDRLVGRIDPAPRSRDAGKLIVDRSVVGARNQTYAVRKRKARGRVASLADNRCGHRTVEV